MSKKDIPSYKFWNWNVVMKVFLEACSPTGRRGRNGQVKSFDQSMTRRRRNSGVENFEPNILCSY